MPVEGHLVGARGGGEGFDADRADAVAVEELARGLQDAFPEGRPALRTAAARDVR